MRDGPHVPSSFDSDRLEITTSVAQPARVHNYLAGGHANFAVDRELADYLSGVAPGEIDLARAAARAQAGFTARAVRYLAVEAGVRQFLCIGATVPSAKTVRSAEAAEAVKDVHEVAQQAASESRIVYVGHDPVVLAHAHALCASTPEGATTYVHGSLHRPQQLLREAAETLDLVRPVAIVLIGVLNFFSDEQDAHGLVAQLLKATASGSYLVVAVSTNEARPELADAVAKRLTEALRRPYVQRSRVDVVRFFDGLELVEDGVVQIDQWRRHEHQPIPLAEESIPIYGGVGRKP